MHSLGLPKLWWMNALAVGAVAAPASLQAQPEGPRRLAVSVSGGASLGSYEAGALYFVVESLRGVPDAVQPDVFVGTSAGAINAFLSVLQLCGPPVKDPEESDFYRTWMPIGFEALFDTERVAPVGALSRAAFDDVIGRLQTRFEAGLEANCDLLLGLTATRVQPAIIPRAQGRLRLPRMAARFLLRVKGRGPGQPPLVLNQLGARDAALPKLPLDGPDADPFASIRDVILASSAFPLAFAPRAIAHCPGRSKAGPCRVDNAQTALFLDGGVFEQNPIGLSAEAMAVHDATKPSTEASLLFLLDPFERAYPTPLETVGAPPVDDGVAFALEVVNGFVGAARSQDLETLLRQSPSLEKRLLVSASQFAPYGDLAMYFMSFFESGLRRFDFHLGMLEARRAVREGQTIVGLEPTLRPLEDATRFAQRDRPGWAGFRCLAAIFEGEPESAVSPGEACQGEEDGLVPLALVSLERVYDACRPDRVSAGDPSRDAKIKLHPVCARAAAGAAPPGADESWRRGPDEDEVAWVFRRLGARGYRFRDLGRSGRADDAYEALRGHVGKLARRFAEAQPGFTVLYRAVADAVANWVAYRPPTHVLHLGVGPNQEVGWSVALGPSPVRWLRADVAVQLQGLQSLLDVHERFLGVAPMAGLSAEVLPASRAEVQLRLGLRGGWLFSNRDRFGTEACDDPGDATRPCSRLIVEAVVTVHLLDLLRFGLVGQYGPPMRAGEDALYGIRPQVGAQVTF